MRRRFGAVNCKHMWPLAGHAKLSWEVQRYVNSAGLFRPFYSTRLAHRIECHAPLSAPRCPSGIRSGITRLVVKGSNHISHRIPLPHSVLGSQLPKTSSIAQQPPQRPKASRSLAHVHQLLLTWRIAHRKTRLCRDGQNGQHDFDLPIRPSDLPTL